MAPLEQHLHLLLEQSPLLWPPDSVYHGTAHTFTEAIISSFEVVWSTA